MFFEGTKSITHTKKQNTKTNQLYIHSEVSSKHTAERGLVIDVAICSDLYMETHISVCNDLIDLNYRSGGM